MTHRMEYTPEQKLAIESRDRNLLILACAGSGKTEVISRRIAMLVKEGFAEKKEIIAFTFTERAANELKARIRKHMEELNPDSPSLGDMYVGTIHSFCLQILKEIEPRYRTFEVMDEARQAALIVTNYPKIGLKNLRGETKTKGYWDTISYFITTLNIIHQQRIQPAEIENGHLRIAVEKYQEIAHGYPNYFFDFDQIISVLIDKLKNDFQKLVGLRNRFKYLVVDEYQDVDDRQEELIQLLSDKGRRILVTAVGDDDQAIYGWRGARIQNILDFKQKYPNVEERKIFYNFRSTHAIVEISDNSIRQLPKNKRIEKEMQAKYWDRNSDPPELREKMAEIDDIQLRIFRSDEDEAKWIGERIKQLRGTIIQEKDGPRAIDFADMAILLRSVKTFGQTLNRTLREMNIRTVVKGAGGLFDNDEVLLAQAAFSLLAEEDFLFQDAGQYVKKDEVETRAFIRDKIQFLRDNQIMPNAKESVFLEWIAEKREELYKKSVEKVRRRRIYIQDIFHEMLDKLGSAIDEPWSQEVLYNFGKLSNLITQFEAVHQWITPRDLPALCRFLGGWAAGNVDRGGFDETVTPNAVQIMTIHAAKGLEWPVVFIPRVLSHHFPSSKRTRGPDTFLSENLFNKKDYISGDDGERRLWYVALTRCRKFLNVTSQEAKGRKPTPFFKNIRHNCVLRAGDIKDRPKGVPIQPASAELFPTTYSDLNYYWRCPFEYQLRSMMGFGPGVVESYGYGQQLHNILAVIHKKAQDGEDITLDTIKELVEKQFHLRYTKDGKDFKPFTRLKEAAMETLLKFQKKYPANSKFILEAEKPFEFIDKNSGALISGSIDLIEEVKKRPDSQKEELKPIAVVDFKAIKWGKDAKAADDFQRRKNEVEIQLQLYAVAAEDAFGLYAQKARAHFLNKDDPPPELADKGVKEVIEVDISESTKSNIKNRVKETIKSIQNSIKDKDFDLKGCKNNSCRKCDFRIFCPGYMKWKRNNKSDPWADSLADSREEYIRSVTE